MSTTETGFYWVSGSMGQDAPSYVVRRADLDLYEGLTRGDFCYVLTARQMGKSSLMVRTAARIRREGVAVAVLDLTAIGQNLSAEQWYDGLRELLGQFLDLEDELEEFWLEHARLGPLQRWMQALREVVLARVPGPIVIFLDEIDAVRSLPFSTDEFFAGIRECYNRRTQDPEFARLTFCLLGVASPSDLIRDTRTTPFNIGRRIELTDFSEAEAAPLAEGLLTSPPAPLRNGEGSKTEPRRTTTPTHSGSPLRFGEGLGVRLTRERDAVSLLHRVLYWTGGHPYLTQRLCRAIVDTAAPNQQSAISNQQFVDALCTDLFLSPRARERDDNLLFVREQLLRSEADLASLLDLYAQIRRGRPVRDDETDPMVTRLRLSGITHGVNGRLALRNRIYEQVFDLAWVRTHMPDAELRRQRAAYRKGLLRTASVSSVILAVVVGLGLTAWSQARRAEDRERTGRRNLYAAQMKVAQEAWDVGNFDLLASIPVGGAPFALALSPDGRRLYVANTGDGTLSVIDTSANGVVATLAVGAGPESITFTPDGQQAYVANRQDDTLSIVSVAEQRVVQTIPVGAEPTGLAFGPNGQELYVTLSGEDAVAVLNAADHRLLTKIAVGSEPRGIIVKP